ncbi:uncharacterized protein LOC108743035 [Agrilus planipennis]|uniref:Uncharacterized protein LOC108743035 n=1 Tax=Agrilus planipennis TaxID=224129 RepID=A0A1W4XN86_AGRPL|nr:uncharacterized protein LOC108743035 [Agrilus planipennis]
MAPFILQMPDKPIGNRRPNLRIMYTQNNYGSGIKISDWEKDRESRPRDNDPFAPDKINLHLANYNRLGCLSNEPYTTTTRTMLEQIKTKHHHVIPNTNKYLVSYYSFQGLQPCFIEKSTDSVCTNFPNDYVTTMQKDYSPPKPIVIKGVALPPQPPGLYKRSRWPDATNVETKFWDDTLLKQICLTQKRKQVKVGYIKKINEL